MNSERLGCYGNCPFRNRSLIRPCSEEIYKNNPTCIENIQKDPSLGEFENIGIQASMNNLMNRQAEVLSSKKAVAIIDRGVIIKLRF